MKRLLFMGVGSALVFTMGGVGPAQADNGPHMSSAQGASILGASANVGAGKCSSCHRAHTAKASKLLLMAQPQLCYTCHGSAGSGASTLVADGVRRGTLAGALRGGGFNSAKIGSGAATKDLGLMGTYGPATTNQTIPVLASTLPTTSRHEIDGIAGTAWGNGPINSGLGKSLTLECGSCHDPHGNGNYRILRPMPVDSQWVVTPAVVGVTANPTANPPVVGVTAVPAVMSPVTTVNIPDVTSSYTTTNYWLSGDAAVPLNATALTGTPKLPTDAVPGTDKVTDGYIQNIAAWCTTCHTRYLAPTGSYKTASGDATFMYRHRSDANYKQGAANCITCHVSHGSNASMAGNEGGLVAEPGVAGVATADSRLLRVDNRGTCVMCHDK